MFFSYVFVLLIGCFVGVIEIASRHTDYRFAAVRSGPGMVYVLTNGIVSILALALIEYTTPAWLGFHADKPEVAHGDTLLCVLTAGLGAGTFLRSSIFKLQAGDKEISVGPALIIEQLLSIIDELVDRCIGEMRLGDVSRIMAPVSFERARTNLPTLCFAGLKRLPKERQEQLAAQIQALNAADQLDEQVKKESLGLTLITVTGKQVLERAVTQLGSIIALPKP